MKPWLALLAVACSAPPPREAPPADPCLDTPECRGYGWCATTSLGCRPTTPAHCRASAECLGFGRCALDGTACAARAEADCRASDDCAINGRCALDVAAGLCAPGGEADCRASEACRLSGRCGWSRGACVAPARP